MNHDYMETRAVNLLDREDSKLVNLKRANAQYHPDEKNIHGIVDKLDRLGTLRCLSRDVLLRLIANPEMSVVPADALASRSVVLAEALLAQLSKAEAGEKLAEEENMHSGQLFGLFRKMYYDEQERGNHAVLSVDAPGGAAP